jgi:biopolymer transport protein ExbD
VLLIIFMIMTPFLVKEQIKINLPKTVSVNTPVDPSRKPVQISVTREGRLSVNGESVADEQLFAAVKQNLANPDTQPVVIAADKDVPFEKVVFAMDAAKRCGARQLGISATHDGKDAPKDAPAPMPKASAAKSAPAPKAKVPPAAEPAKKRAAPAAPAKK